MSFSQTYLDQTIQIANSLDPEIIENIARGLSLLRERNGRLFFIGSGGGAGHASHAVNDFRKIANIECYTPTDNVSELTARINDDGWDTSLSSWLKVSKLSNKDAIFVFSVGGGNLIKKVSVNLINAALYAKKRDTKIFGIVGRDDGFIAKNADNVVIIPNVNPSLITPFSEAYQAVV